METVLTEPPASLAEAQLARKRASMEPGPELLPPELRIPSWQTRNLRPEPPRPPRHTWHAGAEGRAPRELSVVPTCPHPAPPRLVFGSHWNILRRKCQGGIAQSGEMDKYFKGRLN